VCIGVLEGRAFLFLFGTLFSSSESSLSRSSISFLALAVLGVGFAWGFSFPLVGICEITPVGFLSSSVLMRGFFSFDSFLV